MPIQSDIYSKLSIEWNSQSPLGIPPPIIPSTHSHPSPSISKYLIITSIQLGKYMQSII